MPHAKDYRILVGVDRGAGASGTLEWASGLAAAYGGSICAVTAWNYPSPLMMPIVGAPTLPAEFVENKARETLTTALSVAEMGDLEVHEKVVMGGARPVLVKASADHDLLVVGRSGNGRLKRAWLGSTANYCARHARCPVVVVGEATQPEDQWIVAVDGSEPSIEALSWALRLRGPDGVTAVHSFDEWELRDMAGDHRQRSEVPAGVRDRFVQAVTNAAYAADVAPESVRFEIRRGDPRITIVDDAEQHELLVFGSHGHSGLARLLLGSVADYAVHQAQGTVVIWRSRD